MNTTMKPINKDMDINTRFCSICNQPGNRYSWDHIVKPFHKKKLIAKLRQIKFGDPAHLRETPPQKSKTN